MLPSRKFCHLSINFLTGLYVKMKDGGKGVCVVWCSNNVNKAYCDEDNTLRP